MSFKVELDPDPVEEAVRQVTEDRFPEFTVKAVRFTRKKNSGVAAEVWLDPKKA